MREVVYSEMHGGFVCMLRLSVDDHKVDVNGVTFKKLISGLAKTIIEVNPDSVSELLGCQYTSCDNSVLDQIDFVLGKGSISILKFEIFWRIVCWTCSIGFSLSVAIGIDTNIFDSCVENIAKGMCCSLARMNTLGLDSNFILGLLLRERSNVNEELTWESLILLLEKEYSGYIKVCEIVKYTV